MPGHPDPKQRRVLNLNRIGPGRFVFTALMLTAAAWSQLVGGLGAQAPQKLPTGRAEDARPTTVSLYFTDQDQAALLAEQRQLPPTNSPAALGKAIIRELASGPANKNLVRTLPGPDCLRGLFITPDKTAYVDLDREKWQQHPGGVQSDMLAIYAIVNSLVLNMAEIETVKILPQGSQPINPAGHLDLRYPLKANILLIR